MAITLTPTSVIGNVAELAPEGGIIESFYLFNFNIGSDTLKADHLGRLMQLCKKIEIYDSSQDTKQFYQIAFTGCTSLSGNHHFNKKLANRRINSVRTFINNCFQQSLSSMDFIELEGGIAGKERRIEDSFDRGVIVTVHSKNAMITNTTVIYVHHPKTKQKWIGIGYKVSGMLAIAGSDCSQGLLINIDDLFKGKIDDVVTILGNNVRIGVGLGGGICVQFFYYQNSLHPLSTLRGGNQWSWDISILGQSKYSQLVEELYLLKNTKLINSGFRETIAISKSTAELIMNFQRSGKYAKLVDVLKDVSEIINTVMASQFDEDIYFAIDIPIPTEFFENEMGIFATYGEVNAY